jgi:hypothetical protein
MFFLFTFRSSCGPEIDFKNYDEALYFQLQFGCVLRPVKVS